MQHQDGCPLSAASAYKAAALQGQGNYIPELDDSDHDRACPDRRCSTWLDLHTWFGYQPKSLPQIDFQKCFCDIAHGGKGVYERLAVLGEKGLEMMAKVYISEKFCATNCIPFELQKGFPPDMIRYIWTLKRVDRVLSLRALSTFAKTYLSTAQSFPTASCAARYVKAMTGYSMQAHSLMRTSYAENHALETMAYARNDSSSRPLRKIVDHEQLGGTATTGLVYHWAGILLDHIYESQKLKSPADDVEAELIQDLQEYFGYPYDSIIPRIRSIINSTDTMFTESDFDAQAETGRDIIRLWATNYFMSLARHSLLDPNTLERWLRLEIETFMSSQVIAIFAATHFNLLPILNHLYSLTASGSGVMPYIGAAGDMINNLFANGGSNPTVTSPATGEKVEVIRRIKEPKYGAGLQKVERMFLQLLAASYSVVKESDSKRYMPALCQRLRQVQLILHLEELDIRINGPLKSPLALFQGIDIYRWSSISHWGHNNRFGLWQNHPRANHLDAFLPVSDPVIRRRVRQLESLGAQGDYEQRSGGDWTKGPTICQQLLCKNPPGDREQFHRVARDEPDSPSAVNRIPIANHRGVYLSKFGTNKKLSRDGGRNNTLFARLFKGYRNGRNTAGGDLPMWRPPFAPFMAPRPVTFNKGEAYVAQHHRSPLPMNSVPPDDSGRLDVEWGADRPTRVAQPTVIDVGKPGGRVEVIGAASDSGSSSYCSSCSTCIDEGPHDCKGWNSVLRQVRRNTPNPPFAYRRVDGGDNNVVVVSQNKGGESSAVDIYRRRLGDTSQPFHGQGLEGGATAGRFRLNDAPSSILDRELTDPDFRQLITEGPNSIQPDPKYLLGDKVLGLNFDHDAQGNKRLQINSPDGTAFSPQPRKLPDPNLIDIKL